jgi:hypothetical protein
MNNLVLFSTDYQPTIFTTFSSATVKHYITNDFYSDAAHANVGNDEFAFLGGLNMLIQSTEDSLYPYMYVVNNWKKSEYAVAKLSGMYPVMIELTEDNVVRINELALQRMLNCDDYSASKFTTDPRAIVKLRQIYKPQPHSSKHIIQL